MEVFSFYPVGLRDQTQVINLGANWLSLGPSYWPEMYHIITTSKARMTSVFMELALMSEAVGKDAHA